MTGSGFYTGSQFTTFNITVAGSSGDTFLLTLSYSNIGVSYSNGKEVYTINISNTPNPTIPILNPQWGGNTPTNTTYTVNPPLPGWLSLNTNTGTIETNTTSVNAYYREHTITTTGNGGYVGTARATMTIAIAVNAADYNNLTNLIDIQITDQGNLANLNIIDTSRVTNMNALFRGKANFNGDISTWDVSNVTDMGQMFQSASTFNQDLSTWDVSSVNNMRYMFWQATNFNRDISGWDVGNVTDMSGMFQYARAFAQNLQDWDAHLTLDSNNKATITTTNMFNNSGVTGNLIPTWY